MNDDFGPDLEGSEPAAAEVERLLWVRSLLGADMDLGPTDDLVRKMREVRYHRDDLLYRRGSAADRIFFIVSGRVRLSAAGTPFREFESRDVLGFLDALQERPHAFDATVREETLVLELEFEDWQEFIEDNFEFARSVVTRFSRGLDPVSPDNQARIPVARAGSSAFAGRISSFVERLAVLRSSPPLERVSIQALARLASFAETSFLREGERETLLGPGIYVVESGRVRVRTNEIDGKGWIEELEEGSAVAGLGLLERGRLDVEVEAIEASSLYSIPAEILFDVMEDHFVLTSSLLAFVARVAETQALERSKLEALKTPWPIPSDLIV